MSISITLVVASGVHQGKTIPVPTPKFVIGRDPTCQLRPASQLVSKQHCAILLEEGVVYLKDFGSTNGTFVNDIQLEANSTIVLNVGDRLKVGPLDFTVVHNAKRVSDSTPLPDQLKAVSGPAIEKLKEAAGKSSAAVPPAKKPGSSAAMKPLSKSADKHDDVAAMLLSMDNEDPAIVPEGSTIMEMPAVNAMLEAEKAKEAEKKKSAIPTREDSSNAASDILKKMMRRQR